MEIVDDQHHGCGCTAVVHDGQQAFDGCGYRIDPVAGGRVGPQHLGDPGLSTPDGGRPGVERVEQGKQGKGLAQLVTGRPEHLAAGRGGLPGGGPDQGCLADTRFALDEDRMALAGSQLGDPAPQAVELALPADRRRREKRFGHATDTSPSVRVRYTLRSLLHVGPTPGRALPMCRWILRLCWSRAYYGTETARCRRRMQVQKIDDRSLA